MLNRKCLIAETERIAEEITVLTLFIVEGDIYKSCRNQLVSKLADEKPETR